MAFGSCVKPSVYLVVLKVNSDYCDHTVLAEIKLSDFSATWGRTALFDQRATEVLVSGRLVVVAPEGPCGSASLWRGHRCGSRGLGLQVCGGWLLIGKRVSAGNPESRGTLLDCCSLISWSSRPSVDTVAPPPVPSAPSSSTANQGWPLAGAYNLVPDGPSRCLDEGEKCWNEICSRPVWAIEINNGLCEENKCCQKKISRLPSLIAAPFTVISI